LSINLSTLSARSSEWITWREIKEVKFMNVVRVLSFTLELICIKFMSVLDFPYPRLLLQNIFNYLLIKKATISSTCFRGLLLLSELIVLHMVIAMHRKSNSWSKLLLNSSFLQPVETPSFQMPRTKLWGCLWLLIPHPVYNSFLCMKPLFLPGSGHCHLCVSAAACSVHPMSDSNPAQQPGHRSELLLRSGAPVYAVAPQGILCKSQRMEFWESLCEQAPPLASPTPLRHGLLLSPLLSHWFLGIISMVTSGPLILPSAPVTRTFLLAMLCTLQHCHRTSAQPLHLPEPFFLGYTCSWFPCFH
jgi:hypothetical protein